MNKCLSLVHLTSRIGPQSSGSDESASRFLRCPKPYLIRRAPSRLRSSDTYCGGTLFCIELNFRAGNHSPRAPQLRLPTSAFGTRVASLGERTKTAGQVDHAA